MKLEKTAPEMQTFANRLFAIAEQLSGTRPKPYKKSDWYTGYTGKSPFVGFKPVGKRAWKYPKDSLLLCSKWHETLAEGAEGLVFRTDDWWGSPDDNDKPAIILPARPGNAKEVALAERFVRQAYHLHRSSR